jgi:UDP-N-acetylmuramate--alanine ligase
MTHVHFIGIGGSGLSAIARLLLESGYEVSGSDATLSPFALDLRSAGATVSEGHDPANVRGADWVVRSSAIADDNPEVVAAQGAGIPVFKRADFLGQLMQGKTGIAVAGTHGKTTTTAMLAFVLSSLGADPSFIAGGVVRDLGVNARAGNGEAFVIEADEYDRMFLGLKPRIAVITNVEHDHPDCYPTPADFRAAFVAFADLLPADGTLVACADDPGAADVAAEARRLGKKVLQYGAAGTSSGTSGERVLARNLQPNNKGGFTFDASVKGMATQVALQVPGVHNVLNGLAVLAVVSLLGLSLAEAAEALGNFTGAGRRFEVLGEAHGITIVDDYGHHPTEVRATLAAARSRYPGRRIWAIWQPHTYSRTQMLFDEFAAAFQDADEVIVTEIYRSREARQDYSAHLVADAISHAKSVHRAAAHFIPDLPAVTDYLLDHVRPGDVLIVLSAGDADQVSAQVLAHLREHEVHHG